MKRPLPLILSLVLLLALVICSDAEAAVIVFANQTGQPVTFAIVPSGEKIQAYRIAAGDVLPVPVRGRATVRFASGDNVVDRQAAPNSICTFSGTDRLDLAEQRFGGEDTSEANTPLVFSAATDPLDRVGTLPVMILVDEDEPAVRRLWEARLRARVEDASKIFEHHCRMRFEVVAVGTWKSNDAVTDFSLSLREFEREVRLKPPARLAIGFTSQYRKPNERRVHLGGTRGPLHSHLLVREWSQHITEPERLEVLVHELGHVLGASHSAETTSVMRPVVGDRQSRARGFRIGFDPLNTLAMYVFCEQLRLGGARRLGDFSPGSRALLSSVYETMRRQLPDDPAASQYLVLLERASEQPVPQGHVSLGTATQLVVRAVTRAAQANQARPPRATSDSNPTARLEGDALANYYVRAAARQATKLPDAVATKAFLLGLAVALDRSDDTNERPTLGNIHRGQETLQARRARLTVLGRPTIHGREDLLLHFAVSAALCATIGPEGTETIATLKEVSDSHGASGFSFADLAADLAGIELARRLDQSKLSLDAFAESFETSRFVPPPAALPKDMTYDSFKEAYGSHDDPRLHERRQSLRRQVLAMPGYADAPAH